MQQLRSLIDREQEQGGISLTAALRNLYDGDLRFPSLPGGPYIVANFVSTLDGVISFNMPGLASGAEISGSNEADHFIMGLLRASADAIIVGSRTIQDVAPDSLWTAEYSHPSSKDLYDDYRMNTLGKPRFPIVVVVSGSGGLELTRAVFQTKDVRVVIVSTSAGRDALTRSGAAKLGNVEVFALAESGTLDPRNIAQLLSTQFNVQLLLHEGGPNLFTRFLEAGLIHELFLTLAPQIAGRAMNSARPGLVEGFSFLPGTSPWFQLISTKSSVDHLFLRYKYSGARAATTED